MCIRDSGQAEAPDWIPPLSDGPLRFEEPAVIADVPQVEAETEAMRENRLARPELRRAGPSLAHLARPEQSLGRGFWILLVVLVIILAAVLYFFAVAPRIAAAQAQYRAPVKISGRQVAFVRCV